MVRTDVDVHETTTRRRKLQMMMMMGLGRPKIRNDGSSPLRVLAHHHGAPSSLFRYSSSSSFCFHRSPSSSFNYFLFFFFLPPSIPPSSCDHDPLLLPRFNASPLCYYTNPLSIFHFFCGHHGCISFFGSSLFFSGPCVSPLAFRKPFAECDCCKEQNL